jgi:hypothetical protein
MIRLSANTVVKATGICQMQMESRANCKRFEVFYSVEDSYFSLLGYYTMQFSTSILEEHTASIFRVDLISIIKMEAACSSIFHLRSKNQVYTENRGIHSPMSRWYPPTTLHGVITQKTTI